MLWIFHITVIKKHDFHSQKKKKDFCVYVTREPKMALNTGWCSFVFSLNFLDQRSHMSPRLGLSSY